MNGGQKLRSGPSTSVELLRADGRTLPQVEEGEPPSWVPFHALALGLNTHAGQLTNAPVGQAVGIDAVELDGVLA